MTHTQQNLSPRNAFARFMAGSAMLAYGAARIARDPESSGGRLLILLGSMKAAEGVTKFCPVKAMNSSITSSNMLQQMASQNAPASTGPTSNSNMQSGQMSENIMQIVENIMQMFAGGTEAQSAMAGAQSMSGSTGQATANSSNSQQSGSATQTIANIAQTVAPQVGQILNDVASIARSQNMAETNSNGNSATSSTPNGNANSKNTASNNSNSNNSANTNSSSTQSSSSKSSGNNQVNSSSNNKANTNTTTKNKA